MSNTVRHNPTGPAASGESPGKVQIDVSVDPRNVPLYHIYRHPMDRYRETAFGGRERKCEFIHPDDGDVPFDVQADFIGLDDDPVSLSINQVSLKNSDGGQVYPAQRWLKIEDRLFQFTTDDLSFPG